MLGRAINNVTPNPPQTARQPPPRRGGGVTSYVDGGAPRRPRVILEAKGAEIFLYREQSGARAMCAKISTDCGLLTKSILDGYSGSDLSPLPHISTCRPPLLPSHSTLLRANLSAT